MRTCSVSGCDRKHSAKGLCYLHYERQHRGKNKSMDTPIVERKPFKQWFKEGVVLPEDTINECWGWKGKIINSGYGQVGKRLLHVAVYEHFYGPVPKGMVVRHKCDNRLCGNPRHLEIGTYKDNYADMVERRGKGMKLNKEKVARIKRLLIEGNEVKDIAKQYGVTLGMIYHIRNGIAWGDVEAEEAALSPS